MARTLKIVSAALLLLMLAFLSGALLFSASTWGGPPAQSDNSPVPEQVASRNATAALGGNRSDAAAPEAQVGGVLDARPAVRETGPAVVTIINSLSSGNNRSFPGMSPSASGSGVVIDSRGYIVTNQH